MVNVLFCVGIANRILLAGNRYLVNPFFNQGPAILHIKLKIVVLKQVVNIAWRHPVKGWGQTAPEIIVIAFYFTKVKEI